MTSFGLCRQRRGRGVTCPGKRREGEKCAGEADAGAKSGPMPICTLRGKPERPADDRYRTPISHEYPLRATEKVVYTYCKMDTAGIFMIAEYRAQPSNDFQQFAESFLHTQ